MSLVNQRLGFGWLSDFAAGQLGDASKSLHLPMPHFPHLQSFGMCFEPPGWDYTSPRSSGAAGAHGRHWEEPPAARWLWGLAGGISSVLLLLPSWGGDTALQGPERVHLNPSAARTAHEAACYRFAPCFSTVARKPL